MKKLFLPLCFTFLLTACDQPLQNRYVSGGALDIGGGNGMDLTTGSGGGSNTTAGNTNNNSGNVDNTGNNQLGAGYETCNIGAQYFGVNFGYFGACQNSQNERQIKVKFNSSVSNGICFVPMQFTQSGSSVQVGTAECTANVNAGSVYTVPFTKFNVNARISGVMVIQYASLNSFLQCMSLGNANVCQNFVTNHSNAYKQVRFY